MNSPVDTRFAERVSGPAATSCTTPRKRAGVENNFDLIRLLAATQVTVKHCMVHLDVDNHYTDLLSIFPGVPIFFFISGFLIFQSYLNNGDLRKFSLNRLLRIYPGLICCFIVSVGLVLATGYLAPRDLASKAFVTWALAQLSFVQIYNPAFLRGFGVGVLNGSLWTISVELQFYFLTPLLAYLTLRRRWLWAAIIAIGAAANVAAAFWTTGSFESKLFSISFPPWFYMFALGAWLSVREDWQLRLRALGLPTLLGAYFAIAVLGWFAGLTVLGNEINPVSYLFLAALIFKLAYSRPGLSNRLLRRNDISYGVYIYHMPVVNYMVFNHWTGTPTALATTLLVTYGLAVLSWFVIERPALRLKRVALRRY